MFPSRKSRQSLISASCERPGLRMFLFCCLFSLIVSAYWWNFEQRLAKIQPPDGSHRVIDEDKLLSKSELRLFYAWRSKFQKEWNVPLLVQVSAGALQLPPYATSTLFVGAGLSHAEAVIAVPPLVRKALGEGLRLEAEEKLSLCIKNAAPITAYVQAGSAEEQGLKISENTTLEELKSGAAQAITHCLDASLNHIWDAL